MLKLVFVTILISQTVTASLCERWCTWSPGLLCRLVCPDMSRYVPIHLVPTTPSINMTRWECLKDYDELYTTHRNTIQHLGNVITEKNNIYSRMLELQQHRDDTAQVYNISQCFKNQQNYEIQNRALLSRQLYLEHLITYAYHSSMVVPTVIIPDSTEHTIKPRVMRGSLSLVFLSVHIILIFKLHEGRVYRSPYRSHLSGAS